MAFLYLFAALVSSWIIYSDCRWRVISLWQLLAMAAASTAFGLVQYRPELLLIHTAVNVLFLLAQFFLLWIWFSIRHRRPIILTDRYIGLGDLLYLLVLTPALSPYRFIWFYSIGNCLILLAVLLIKTLRPGALKTIPLAAALAGWFVIYLMIQLAFPTFDFRF